MTESCYRVCAVFILKDNESKDSFVKFANGENGLVKTGRRRLKSIDMYESREDSNKLVIWQCWDSKEDQQVHLKHAMKMERSKC